MIFQEIPLKRLFGSVIGGSWGIEPEDGEVTMSCIRAADFDYEHLRANAHTAPMRGYSVAEAEQRQARAGDIILEKSGGGEQTPVGRAVLCTGDRPVVPTNFAARLRPAPDVDAAFACFLLASLYSAGWTRATMKQTTGIQNLDSGAFLSRRVSLPSFKEQRAIADYLDAETSRIDALIVKKRRMIELLGERRAIFTSHAVSHGVVPAPVAETGNPFAPTVPQGWQLMRLKHVVERIVDTAHKTAPEVAGGEYLIVRTSNVKSGALVLEGAKYTDEAGFREWTKRGVPRSGDVLLTREAPAGEACLVPGGLPLCIGQRMVWLEMPATPAVLGKFLLYSLYSGPGQEFIRLLSRSTTVAHLNMADIPSIPIAVPPTAEQSAIVSEIDREVLRVGRLAAQLAQQVDLLNERRQALITAAVTGELDIPGAAA